MGMRDRRLPPLETETKAPRVTKVKADGRSLRVPDWHWQAIALWSKETPFVEICEAVGKKRSAVEAVLYGAWGKEQRRELQRIAMERGLKEAADPIVKAQAAAPRAMDRLIEMSETADKPADVITASTKVLDYAGYKPVERSMHLSVEARIRDQQQIPDSMLEAFANGGEIPEALRPLLALEAPKA